MDTVFKKTPLYGQHVAAGGKLIDFGGWTLPVQYVGILEEHQQVRQHAGLFDVSHMGEISIKGSSALRLVNQLITNDAKRLQLNQVMYSPMCLPNGGVVDDLLVYRLGEEEYLLVVNAANTQKDFQWIKEHQAGKVKVENISTQTAQLALQGPESSEILQQLTKVEVDRIKYYWCTRGMVAGVDCLISRTGYTGEDGFELYCDAARAEELWQKILEVGAGRVKPVGLGARDTLRFEACLPLYGHELTEEVTPLEAGLDRFVQLDKPAFIGREALAQQAREGVPKKLVGFRMVERAVPRAQYPLAIDGKEVGLVTSGSFSPTLQENLGLGYIPSQYAREGQQLEVLVRGKSRRAEVIKTPFYTRR